jgi:GxxExxY protein
MGIGLSFCDFLLTTEEAEFGAELHGVVLDYASIDKIVPDRFTIFLLEKTMRKNSITKEVLKAAFTVHPQLGPGLLESAYEACLFYEIIQLGLEVERQVAMPLIYKEIKMETGYRLDLLVQKKVIIEVKAVETFTDVHIAQMITYLKLSNCKIGLLINFHVSSLKNGIKRIIY